jgi:hypothetical protein
VQFSWILIASWLLEAAGLVDVLHTLYMIGHVCLACA